MRRRRLPASRKRARSRARSLLSPVLHLALAPIPTRRADPLRKLYRAWGKIAALSSAGTTTSMRVPWRMTASGCRREPLRAPQRAADGGGRVLSAFLLLVFVGLSPFALRDLTSRPCQVRATTGAGDAGCANFAFASVFGLIVFAPRARDGLQARSRRCPSCVALLLVWCLFSSPVVRPSPASSLRRAGLESSSCSPQC